MNIKDIKVLVVASALSMFSVAGLSSCSTGTDPGEINTERSDIKEEGSMIEKDDDPMSEYRDTTDMESHYDHADHENHDDNRARAIGDGAYDGKGKGVKRDDVKKQ
ncbi:hypothetical protein ABID22_001838 [Pontibacter aydingkolensis]|uniref:Lipoprotein n=1 Tax=Pontibacter aydingkolensis TaxID=1911536 RepID=A0ABS7CPP8_9BACT|nr:hypothetical protein [Pontibacter aydingkolensis]MBW7465778.1 hypothetical protein [Pontibacter aydingkolensis]